ncbi:MAG: GspH/FimT family pseudopilin [Gammaproteobacteria bacterium]|nr:GspH/FimT family pseudopilin [Gammaproteobacteria bacterium]MDE2024286.1 GspH/FimT family pseudopilin [Gammaproteobacteria bacterium]MDE2273094.1 GspH/FimT family pseudopilin [Gammaproteobacteria bacterium]
METVRFTRGFTLIELLVLVVVLGIVTAMAVPNFSATIKNARDVSQVNALITGFTTARSAAVKNGSSTVTICAGTTTACGGATWAAGWVVFYATPPPGAATVIRAFPPISGGNTFTSNGGYSFTFNPNGLPYSLTNAPPANATVFTLCDGRGPSYGRSLTLLPTGSLQAAQKTGYQVNGTTAISSC